MNPAASSPATNPDTLFFRITAEMIADFAKLTGDHSSLHTNEAFARRTQYRQTIAHGFLPLLFLAAVPAFNRHRLRRLSAFFSAPVFPGTSLSLALGPATPLEGMGSTERELFVSETDSGTVLTTGTVEMDDEYAAEGALLRGDHGPPASMLPHPLDEHRCTLEEIKAGDLAGFEFRLEPAHGYSLLRLLGSGMDKAPENLSSETSSSLLAASLFSTLVGMCLPGRAATFLNFEVTFAKPFAFAKTYRCRSVVAFKSATTKTMSQNITITDADDGIVHATGKTHALVNPPPALMPTMAQLKAEAVDLDLRGKVVLVTGASRGIGETTAKLFALHGAKVVVNYFHSETEAARIVDEIEKEGGEALAAQADVADRGQVRAMVERVTRHFGPVDVLVNNAVRDFQAIAFLELTWDRVAQDLDVIVKGAFNCCQEVLPGMMTRRAGKIVNVSTQAVELPPAAQAKYVIAKSALVGLTRSLAVEFAPHNIQANLVVPGLVETDLTQHLGKLATERVKHETPMQRLATPVDVARAIVFLASSLSAFTTGQKIPVTGGGPPMF